MYMRYYLAFNNVGISHIMFTHSTASLENTQGFMKVGFVNKTPFWYCMKCDSEKRLLTGKLEEAWKKAIEHYNNEHRL